MLFVWISALLIAVMLEVLTCELVAVWFMPAAIISIVLSLVPAIPWWVQVVVFVMTGLAFVIATRPICRKLTKGKNTKTNVNALIGRTCIVTEEIRNLEEVGEVKINGLCWSARAQEESRVILVGELVEIVEVSGVKLIVK